MISTSVKTNSVNRRDRQALLDAFYDGALPTDTLMTDAEYVAAGGTTAGADYVFYPSTYWWNEAKDTAQQEAQKYAMHMDFNAATGTANGDLIIYHHGHETGVADRVANDLILLQAAFPNYDILQTYMPGYVRNDTVGGSKARGLPAYWGNLAVHTIMAQTAPNLTFRHFTWPTIAAINHFESSYNNIYLMGFSGGGMTTLWAGSIDTRPAGVFPMAGFVPDYYAGSAGGAGPGDGEQELGTVYSKASRLGMCALAAESWCRCCWNFNDTVIWLPAAEGTITETAVQAVSPNFNVTVNDGAVGHGLEADWFTAINSDLTAL